MGAGQFPISLFLSSVRAPNSSPFPFQSPILFIHLRGLKVQDDWFLYPITLLLPSYHPTLAMSLVKSFLKLNTKWKLNQSSTSTILLLLNHAQHIQIKLNIIRATLKDMCNGLQHTTTIITTRLRDRQVRRRKQREGGLEGDTLEGDIVGGRQWILVNHFSTQF